MLIKRPDDIHPSEITSHSSYLNRRRFIGAAAAALLAPGLAPGLATAASRQILTHDGAVPLAAAWLEQALDKAVPGQYSTQERPTPFEYVSGYNNFYEFGMDKTDPAEKSRNFRTDPWSVEIAGEAEMTGVYHLEDLIKPQQVEERIYRLRCVEAWSMVVPWLGVPLAALLKRFKPNSNAKYVRFETLYDPQQMPGQKSGFSAIDYPYVEGLRIDEAMNELAFMAVGVYGQHLPNQNGAPFRLVVPWKYGFKSIKSVVKIEFTRDRPKTTWELTNSREYGFYANVNPEVDHPRWSQATERRLPSSLFSPNRQETLMFNGYAPQVAKLYTDLNLRRYF